METMDRVERLLDVLRSRAGGCRAHVLVVDDDADIRATLVELFEGEGFTVTGAADGADGLAQARERRPDLVLLDMMMPVMNGHEFLAALKPDPSLADIRVVVMRDGHFAVEGGPTPPDPAAPGLRGVRLPPAEQDADLLPEARAAR